MWMKKEMKDMRSNESKKTEGKDSNKERSVKGMKNFIKKIGLIAVMVAFLGGTGVTMAALTENPVMAQETGESKVEYVKTNSKYGYSIPAEITIKKGEKKVVELKTPSGTTDVCNIKWSGTQLCSIVASGGFGSYWGQPGRCILTGKSVGTTTCYVYVEILGKKGDPKSYKKTICLESKLNVVDQNGKLPAKTTLPLQNIKLNKTSSDLEPGQSINLSVSYTPSNTTDSKNVSWSSSDSFVASVNNGKVVAKKTGTATITARVGKKTATCRINVKIPLKSISLSKTNITVKPGETSWLYYTKQPSDTTEKGSVNWSSNNTSVATVSGGKVVAKKEGTATITARLGSKTATCKVTVKGTGGSSSVSGKETYLNVSQAYTLTNNFRTTRSNQWYWNKDNKTKTYTYGLKSLTRDTTLESIARQRAKEQWTQYYINGKKTHDRPNGSSCWTAYTKGSNPCGENLAWGHKDCRTVVLDPDNGWAETNKKYADQGHRRGMLSYEAKRVGIACYVKNGKTCWAMCLGR